MARKPQCISKIVPKATRELALRDRLHSGTSQKLTGICVTEMSEFFLCMKKYSFNEAACPNELAKFQQCYDRHMKIIYQPERSGEKKLADINKLLKTYSTRRPG